MALDKLIRDFFRLPDSSAKPKYPYNKVKQSASGHRWETDDTPGKERLFTFHKSGTYDEIAPDGKRTTFTTGNHHDYTKGTKTITIDGFYDVISQGSKLIVKGGSLVEVLGDYSIKVAGHTMIVSAEDMKFVTSGNMVFSADGDITMTGKTLTTNISGDTLMNTGGIYNINSGGKYNLNSGDTISIKASGDVQVYGNEVSVGKIVYIGQDSLGGKTGEKIMTEGGPSSTSKAKV